MLVGAIMFHARRPRIHLISHGATQRFTSVASYMDRPVERQTTDMGPQPIPNLASWFRINNSEHSLTGSWFACRVWDVASAVKNGIR